MTDFKPLTDQPITVEITRVETIPLKIPLREPTKISHEAACDGISNVMLVRLHSDAGVAGYR